MFQMMMAGEISPMFTKKLENVTFSVPTTLMITSLRTVVSTPVMLTNPALLMSATLKVKISVTAPVPVSMMLPITAVLAAVPVMLHNSALTSTNCSSASVKLIPAREVGPTTKPPLMNEGRLMTFDASVVSRLPQKMRPLVKSTVPVVIKLKLACSAAVQGVFWKIPKLRRKAPPFTATAPSVSPLTKFRSIALLTFSPGIPRMKALKRPASPKRGLGQVVGEGVGGMLGGGEAAITTLAEGLAKGDAGVGASDVIWD